jgi:hypothetical protein
MSNRGFGFGYSAAGGGVPFGCATYINPSTPQTFTVPTGVTKISVVIVAKGFCGGFYDSDDNKFVSSGGGGGLSYTNCIPVTPGESLTIKYCFTTSSLNRGATNLVLAYRGSAGNGPAINNQTCGIGAVKYNGGIGSNYLNSGGGGAAGYAGNGGIGGAANISQPAGAGSGGGGGGGGSPSGYYAGGGGGTGLIVQGSNGAAGSGSSGGGGGSGGTPGYPSGPISGIDNRGGPYGGGAGMSGWGACGGLSGFRIIYGGTGKSYPNNSAP